MATATEAIAPPRARARSWQPGVGGWAARIGVLALIFGGLIFLTATVEDFWANRIAFAAVFAIIGLSVNVILGYVGQVSLGHQAFVGIAAFVAGYYVTERAGCVNTCPMSAFATAMVLATAISAVAAGILGLVALRIGGLYLALITLAYGFMAEKSIFLIPFLTRGGAGMPAPRPASFASDTSFAFLTLAFLALILFIDWALLRSKVGRAILSVKHSEPVAASYGINVTAYKVLAFVMSGVFAGVGGALFAFRNTQVTAVDFTFTAALVWVLMVVVGGLGSRTGVVIGSAFFALFEFLVELIEPLTRFLTGSGRPVGDYVILVGALLAIFTIIQFPGGIAEQISPITRWLRGGAFTLHPDGHGHKPRERPHGRKPLLERVGVRSAERGDAPAHAGPYIAQTGLQPGFLGRLGLGPAATSPVPAPESASEASEAPAARPTTEVPTTAEDDDTPWRRPGSSRSAGSQAAEPEATVPLETVASEPEAAGDGSSAPPAAGDGVAETTSSSGPQPGFLARLGLGSSRPKKED